jgi:type I restriction enzyme M protein
MSENQKQQLEQQLWNIADTLRGKMSASQYQDYILGFIFYKYLSDKMVIYANGILEEDGIRYETINEKTEDRDELIEAVKEEAIESLGYFLRPDELFEIIAKKGNSQKTNLVMEKSEPYGEHSHGEQSNFILKDLGVILKNIESSTMGNDSEDDFIQLFEDLDLNSSKLGKTPEQKNQTVAKILGHLDKIDFKLEDTEADVLGDAYEYLIGKFASDSGQNAGEFYTPQQVSTVLARLVIGNKTRLKNVYDPTCGSGSLLLRVQRELKAKKNGQISKFHGQELNRTTFNLARMNMILHDVHYSKFDLKQDDTLESPQHLDLRFEAIVANPPFSAKWSANPIFESEDRFEAYGKLAPKSKADFAFVQHMIYQLADNGTMAVVLPHGVLFRGGAEGKIRQFLIQERNYLDAVIGLPANIFYGTSIPTCILVFKKCRENPKNVLFIDASKHFDKEKNQNVINDDHIDEIFNTYQQRTTKDKYSYVATLEEIEENDFNLNIPRYVDTFEEETPIDLEKVAKEIVDIDKAMEATDATIADFCKQLGIATPF